MPSVKEIINSQTMATKYSQEAPLLELITLNESDQVSLLELLPSQAGDQIWHSNSRDDVVKFRQTG